MTAKKTFLGAVLLAIFSSIVGGILGATATLNFLDREDDGAPTPVNVEEVSFVEAWEASAPAVVSIVARKDLSEIYNPVFGLPNADEDGLTTVSSGSGFIISADGLVVTNRHVVLDESAEYVVILDDGTELDGEVLDRDDLNDIALLRIKSSEELPFLKFADSDAVRVGEPVLAIGNALGLYSTTTTAGIISATGRQISASVPGAAQESLIDLIQTDAAINPGNSGGPLVNLAGEVLGMNTAIDATAEGIGFAIPSKDISAVVSSYQEFGKIVRPFLGVRYIFVNEGVKERFSLEESYGAILLGDDEEGLPAVVKGSPADKAGLQAEDVILEVEGEKIGAEFTLTNALLGHQVGDTIKMKIWRDGKTLEVAVKLEERGEE